MTAPCSPFCDIAEGQGRRGLSSCRLQQSVVGILSITEWKASRGKRSSTCVCLFRIGEITSQTGEHAARKQAGCTVRPKALCLMLLQFSSANSTPKDGQLRSLLATVYFVFETDTAGDNEFSDIRTLTLISGINRIYRYINMCS